MAIAMPLPTTAPRRPVRSSATVRPVGRSATRPAVARPATGSGLRLTARGRIVLLVAAIAAVLAVLVSTGPVQAGSTVSSAPATDLVVVQPGQSLWSIAADVAPDADRRSTVDAIMTLNGLADAVVHPGQPLVVPVG